MMEFFIVYIFELFSENRKKMVVSYNLSILPNLYKLSHFLYIYILVQ